MAKNVEGWQESDVNTQCMGQLFINFAPYFKMYTQVGETCYIHQVMLVDATRHGMGKGPCHVTFMELMLMQHGILYDADACYDDIHALSMSTIMMLPLYYSKNLLKIHHSNHLLKKVCKIPNHVI